VEIQIVNFGAGELGFVADTDTLCYGGPECLAILLWEYLFSASWVVHGGFKNCWFLWVGRHVAEDTVSFHGGPRWLITVIFMITFSPKYFIN
jgi:hypothetical protein